MGLRNTRSAKIAFCGTISAVGAFILYQAYLLPWPASEVPASWGASLVAIGSFYAFLLWYIHEL